MRKHADNVANVDRVENRQTTPVHGNVGLRDGAANPTYGGMAGEWKEILFGDCAARVRDVVQPHSVGSTTPYIGLEHIAEGALHLNGQAEASLATSAKTRFQYGDILFGKLRPYFRKVVRPKFDGICSTDIWAVRAKKGVDQGFLFYRMASEEFIEKSSGASTGTRMPRADWDFLSKWLMPLPPLPEQKAIAHILGTLDDKIELNRWMNATLEAMARALFQSWFVDFYPVRAKLDGRQPAGLDADTAALFPAHFQDSPIGHIPQGWEVGRLDDVLTLQRGFDLPTPDRTHGKYPVMAASGPNGCHDKFMVRGPGVTTGRSGVLGKVFFIHGDFWPLNTSLWVKEFKRVSPAYAFHLLRGLDFEIFNAGSAVPTLNRNHVHNLPVVIPPKPIVDAFDALVMSLMKQQKANEDQSRTLATIRDALLPKLLSGELRVKDNEQVSEVA